jgi:alkylation response protein AidB-like acyl-CoA dehydrogenase
MIKDTAAEFAKKEIAPTIADDYREKRFPYEIIEKMGKLGF